MWLELCKVGFIPLSYYYYNNRKSPPPAWTYNDSWHKVSRKTISRAQRTPKEIVLPSKAEQQCFITDLEKLDLKAFVLSSFLVQPRFAKTSKYPALPSLPPTIMSLDRVHYQGLNEKNLVKICKDVFENLTIITKESTLFQSTLQ